MGLMAAAAQSLLGQHDFHSFETDWPNRKSSVRTVLDLQVERSGTFVTIEVEADGFLYNMVRSIAGTLVWVGCGKRPPEWVARVLQAENRIEAGPTAPPQGCSYSQSGIEICMRSHCSCHHPIDPGGRPGKHTSDR